MGDQRIVRVGVFHIGQQICPAAPPGASLFTGAEVGPVDPYQVHRAIITAGLKFGQDAVDGVGCVGHGYPAKFHTLLRCGGGQNIVNVFVALLVSAIHPEVHCLAVGFSQNVRVVAEFLSGSRCRGGAGCQQQHNGAGGTGEGRAVATPE